MNEREGEHERCGNSSRLLGFWSDLPPSGGLGKPRDDQRLIDRKPGSKGPPP